jgi:hypothetical protein
MLRRMHIASTSLLEDSYHHSKILLTGYLFYSSYLCVYCIWSVNQFVPLLNPNQPRGNGGWDRSRPPQNTNFNRDQRVPIPLNNKNNIVDHGTSPWCNPCEQPQDQDTCIYAINVMQHVREANREKVGRTKANNYVRNWMDIVNNVTTYNVSEEHMKEIKGKSIDASAIARALDPNPSQEEIKW